jgi:Clr5 domain
MASAQFVLCTPGTPSISGRAPRISAREWDAHRQKIETLYIKEDETLDKVIAIMSSQYAFVATYVQCPSQMKSFFLLTQRTGQPSPVYSQTPIVENTEEYTGDSNA